ncbi:carbohydrate-binding domain-containing protein [Paenibacillus sp. H1-7]|uniref:carbohydrate-binding domain-containing protein n=1 Tax=Paenibacillus sp. H1-7 TaxID=2282849 RepID=UPI001EF979DF|nr:carbohydrate-binding domain-containing protein [Paenibacillus sp. H1-7]ULL19329.1 carbohydrate-binding domain-containing protein [Paenibacillus sp. H1-7]
MTKYNKHKSKFLFLALLSAMMLPACQDAASTANNAAAAQNTAASASASTAAVQASAAPTPVTFSENDEYTDWKAANPIYIELSESGAAIKGQGAEAKDRTVTITAAGTYVLSGQWEQGQVVVDAPKEAKVRLVLNGVSIHSNEGSAIYVKQADKAIITLQEGTKNDVADAAQYTTVDADSGEPNAAIFSKDDLTFNGSGALTVQGNYNNGITSKDDLKMTGGSITVHAADDGVMGRDLVAIKDGTLTIEAAGDGIKSTNDTDASKGLIAIDAGTFSIKAGKDGIQAVTHVQMNGGSYTISSGGGSANAVAKPSEMNGGMRGSGGRQMDNQAAAPTAPSTQPTQSTESAESTSGKAIKAGTAITIAKGTFTMDSADDAIHSNNSVTIAGGEFAVTSGDDGIHADSSVVISGGTIQIAKSYEGIEGSNITISGGDIKVTASDDGINVAGGADGSSTNGRPGQNNFSAASSNNKLTITGGSLYVNSTGDGLDSNGSIVMSGGNVVVSGPTENGNGALDYDGTFELTGGLLMAAGSSGMAQAPSDTSSQHSILMTYSQSQKAGTVVELKDKDGKTIASLTPDKSFQTVVIGSPELKKDAAYSLYTGGTKTVEFTVANITTWLNESGVTTARSGGPGGLGGGPGGGPGGGARPNGQGGNNQGRGDMKQP